MILLVLVLILICLMGGGQLILGALLVALALGVIGTVLYLAYMALIVPLAMVYAAIPQRWIPQSWKPAPPAPKPEPNPEDDRWMEEFGGGRRRY
jgi:hypothetical protein